MIEMNLNTIIGLAVGFGVLLGATLGWGFTKLKYLRDNIADGPSAQEIVDEATKELEEKTDPVKIAEKVTPKIEIVTPKIEIVD